MQFTIFPGRCLITTNLRPDLSESPPVDISESPPLGALGDALMVGRVTSVIVTGVEEVMLELLLGCDPDTLKEALNVEEWEGVPNPTSSEKEDMLLTCKM